MTDGPRSAPFPSSDPSTAGAEIPADFAETLERVSVALAAMGRGDAGPFAACWTTASDATLIGGFGTHRTGVGEVRDALEWVASRFRGGPLVAEYSRVSIDGDWAFTVGHERGRISVDGADAAPFEVRVTHVYRRGPEGWRIVHRHGDHTPSEAPRG